MPSSGKITTILIRTAFIYKHSYRAVKQRTHSNWLHRSLKQFDERALAYDLFPNKPLLILQGEIQMSLFKMNITVCGRWWLIVNAFNAFSIHQSKSFKILSPLARLDGKFAI